MSDSKHSASMGFPSGGLRHVRECLNGFLGGVAGDDACLQVEIADRWEALVGQRLAPHTKPLRLKEGVLHISAEDSAWASELRWTSQTLIANMRKLLGSNQVREIHIKIGYS